MNRTILIVICDFLLVSLLAFSTVDINRLSEVPETAVRPKVETVSTNDMGGSESTRDLANVMRLALDEERRDRERLAEELARARKESEARDAQLQEFQENLRSAQDTNRVLDSAVQQFQQRLRGALETNRHLDAAIGQVQQRLQTTEQANLRLQQEQTTLQRQYASAQTNLAALSQRLQETASQATVSTERAAALEAELKREATNAAVLRHQMAMAQQSNQFLATEKQQLSGRLQVIEAEKRIVSQQVVKMEEQIKLDRQEKAKLADGVKNLAESSTQLVQEIRENRPLASNLIFTDFLTNRVAARFVAMRGGLIDTTRRRDTQTLVVNDGTNLFGLTHVQDTPLALSTPGVNWDRVTGLLRRGNAEVPIRSLAFYFEDPRVILVPLTPAEVQRLGAKTYRISTDPFKFQDAVLVGTSEAYYGECRFQIDVSTPGYVRLDRSFVRGLLGQFNPSRGDLVFSRTGELLGIMANDTYCLMLRDFSAAATLRLGAEVGAQPTGDLLSRLHAVVLRKPSKLQ